MAKPLLQGDKQGWLINAHPTSQRLRLSRPLRYGIHECVAQELCGSSTISDAADVIDLHLFTSEKHPKLPVWSVGHLDVTVPHDLRSLVKNVTSSSERDHCVSY